MPPQPPRPPKRQSDSPSPESLDRAVRIVRATRARERAEQLVESGDLDTIPSPALPRGLRPSLRTRAADAVASTGGRIAAVAAAVATVMAAATPLVLAVLERREDASAALRASEDRAGEHARRIAELEEQLAAHRRRIADWQRWVDASLCALGARPSYGCAPVEMLPAPLGGSAPSIQPRVVAEPPEHHPK